MQNVKLQKYIGVLAILFLLVGCGKPQEQFLVAEITPVKNDANSIVTIISDDGNFESGKILNEFCNEYNIRATIAGVVEWMSSHLDEWKGIEAEGNVELISHSYSHVKMNEEANLSEEELEHQITESIDFFKNNFATDQIAFVTPENIMCSKGYKILQKNQIYAVRQGKRGENHLTPFSGIEPFYWYNLGTRGIGDVTTTKERNNWVDSSIDNQSWLIEMWHTISPDGVDISQYHRKWRSST